MMLIPGMIALPPPIHNLGHLKHRKGVSNWASHTSLDHALHTDQRKRRTGMLERRGLRHEQDNFWKVRVGVSNSLNYSQQKGKQKRSFPYCFNAPLSSIIKLCCNKIQEIPSLRKWMISELAFPILFSPSAHMSSIPRQGAHQRGISWY